MMHGPARRLVVATLAAVLVVGLAGCSMPSLFSLTATPSVSEGLSVLSSQKTASLSTPTLREEGYLTVGISTKSTTAPLYIEDASGNISGIDVDIASALADELGLKVKFVSVDDADSAAANTVDIVMGASSGNLSASELIDAYAESAPAFFTKGSNGIVTASELANKTVGIQAGSVSESALNATTLGMSRQTFSNLNEAFEALESGSVDYVLCDAYAGAYLASSYDDIGFAGTLSAPSSYGIAVSTSNTTLKQAVEQAFETIENNGIYDGIRTHWVADLPSLTSTQQIVDIPTSSSTTSTTGTSTAAVDSDSSSSANDGSTAGSNAVIL